MTTTRQSLIDSGLFRQRTGKRDLVAEVAHAPSSQNGQAAESIRVILSFDPFGDIVGIDAHTIDEMERAVAGNRRALGLPPQET